MAWKPGATLANLVESLCLILLKYYKNYEKVTYHLHCPVRLGFNRM
jgi:hypothetical protein